MYFVFRTLSYADATSKTHFIKYSCLPCIYYMFVSCLQFFVNGYTTITLYVRFSTTLALPNSQLQNDHFSSNFINTSHFTLTQTLQSPINQFDIRYWQFACLCWCSNINHFNHNSTPIYLNTNNLHIHPHHHS